MKCPKCDVDLLPDTYGLDNWSDGEGATLDCISCKGLLIIDNGVVCDFHKTLNASNQEWPADGNGTGFVDV